jgi:hypothetical protein
MNIVCEMRRHYNHIVVGAVSKKCAASQTQMIKTTSLGRGASLAHSLRIKSS